MTNSGEIQVQTYKYSAAFHDVITLYLWTAVTLMESVHFQVLPYIMHI